MAGKKSSSSKSKQSKKKNAAVPDDEYTLLNPIFIHGVVLAALTMITTVSMYISTGAIIPSAIKSACGGLFGITAYAIPAIFAGVLIYLATVKSVGKMWQKLILLFLELSDLSAIIGLFAKYDASAAYSICAAYTNGGGVVGVWTAQKLSGLISSICALLLLVILFVVIGCLIARFNIVPYAAGGLKRFIGVSSDAVGRVKEKTSDYAERRREEKERAAAEAEDDPKPFEKKRERLKHEPLDEEEIPEGLGERRRRRENAERAYTGSPMDIAKGFADDLEITGRTQKQATLADKDIGFGASEDFDLYSMSFSEDDIIIPGNTEPELPTEPAAEPEPSSLFDESIFNTYTDEPVPVDEAVIESERRAEEQDAKKNKKLTDTERDSFMDELTDALGAEHYEYCYPTLELLDKAKQVSNDQRRELYEKAEQLIAVLENFGVKAKPVQVTQGPTVTRYEIQPSSGTKLSKIVGLADDIALNLAVSTVLIAPVPGKAATVGVEIPNKNVTPVTIREMLESPEFRNAKSKLTVCLGKDIGGNVVVGDIAKWPHALIAGATGSGKSVCINTIVTSILYKASPDEVKLIMIDPKQVELGVYNGIPHLLIPVVTEAKKAAGALNWAVQEMMHRYELFKETGVRKLEGYNKLMEAEGGDKMPQIVIIVDELADLMMVAAKEVEDYICRLAQLARAAGIHLIIATQRPSVDVITGLIKANIPSRIAFFVSSQVDSRTILDKAGAEKLLGMGDMLYFPTGARSTRRVQGAFVSDGEVERIIEYIKTTSPETHYSEDLAEHIERIQLGENGVTPDKEDDGDPLLHDAVRLAVELGRISTSMVQRRLSVGYSRAGRIIDQMEKRGIISPANGSKPREVLISLADAEKYGIDMTAKEFGDE